MIANKDAANFPFLRGAKEFVKVSIDDLDTRAVDDYLFSVYRKKPPEYIERESAEEAVKKFVGCSIILNLLNKHHATYTFAKYEANKAKLRLQYLHDKKRDWLTYVELIIKTVYKKPPKVRKLDNNITDTWYISSINDYLELIQDKIGNPHFELPNQVAVVNGYVFYECERLFEILYERIKYFIVERINEMPLQQKSKFHEFKLPQKVTDLANKYRYIDTFTKYYKYKPIPTKDFNLEELHQKVLKLKKGQTPPCVAKLIDEFGSRPISHFERFLLATFLLSKQTPMDEIIEIYAKDAKFDRSITTMQLKQLMTRDYTPPSCNKIALNKCCYYSKDICGFIKNPIQLIENEL